MKKRVLSILLSLIMIVACFPLSIVHAIPEKAPVRDMTIPTISVGSTFAKAGTTVSVDVTICDNPGIAGARITLSYDAGLTLINAVSGPAFEVLDYTRPGNYSSPCNFNWDSESAETHEDGTILTLTFAVADDAAADDDLAINLSYQYGDIYDFDLNSIQVCFVNGYIDVIDFIYGDVNDDGTVNGKDVTLIRRFNAGGYDVSINEAAADVNCDGTINGKDVTLIRRFIAGGYDITLPVPVCLHDLEHFEAVEANCVEDGNIEYWHCTKCGKYYSDAAGRHAISYEDVVIPATGHSFADEWSNDATYHWHAATCEHENVVSDRAEHTFNAQGICTVCGYTVNTPNPDKPYSIEFRIVEYNTNLGDEYIGTQAIDNSANEEHMYFSAEETFELKPLVCAGYSFLGWYTPDGERMTSVPVGTNHNLILYARWNEITYDITYRVYLTPVGAITDERYLHYTVSKGLQDLPNPTINNYEFLGWYTDATRVCRKCGHVLSDNEGHCTEAVHGFTYTDESGHVQHGCACYSIETIGGKAVTRIPVGTTGNIVLNAYYTSYRNMAKKTASLDDPTVIVDNANGVIYFAYKLGTIENVPVSSALWSMQGVVGLEQHYSETVTTTISETIAQTIADTVTETTVDSNTWRLAEEWNDSTHVDEGWAQQHGMTVEEAETILKGTTNTYSVTSETGGSSTSTSNTGITTLTYDSQNQEDEHGTKLNEELNWKVTDTTHWNVNGELKLGKNKTAGFNIGGIPLKAGGTIGFNAGLERIFGLTVGGEYGKKQSVEVGGKIGGEWTTNSKTNKHSGSDTTTTESYTNANTSTWNNSQTASSTQQASQSNTVSQVISDVLSSTYNVGTSYGHGTSQTSEQGFSNSNSQSVNTTNTVTYSTAETRTTTRTYSSDGKSGNGWYRLVIASRVHVFGIVGYDVASKSYFTYTYSIMDDETYDFLDFSPDAAFNDNENCALPFEVPFDICEYVREMTIETDGLLFRPNSTEGTATVEGYVGTSSDVHIPSFCSNGGQSYTVTAISASAFAGKNIRSIILSEYIDEIPDRAFKDCTSLESVWGRFTRIGSEAFSGCTSLTGFEISSFVCYVGTDAFKDVPEVYAHAINEKAALYRAYRLNPDAENIEELIPFAKEITANTVSSLLTANADSIILDLSETIDGVVFTLDVPQIDAFELLGGSRAYTDLRLTSNAESTIIRNTRVQDCTRIPLVIASDNIILDRVNVSGSSFALLAKSQSSNITLVRDNTLTSASGNAVVCKNPTLVSEISTRASIGVLDVSGNVYVCGNPPIPGVDYLDVTNGDIIYIDDDQFNSLIRGCFTVTLDANGGSFDDGATESFDVEFGAVYGDSIDAFQPTMSIYDFDGWFTEPEGGIKITADTVSTELFNQTLYAHWTLKQYTVNFNANGGTCSTESMSAVIGIAPESLPTASLDYNSFCGWYTEAEGGEQVTLDNWNTIIEGKDELDLVLNGLTLYAHWELNPVSDWVLESDMPNDAQIVDEKWTYTLTTTVESTATSMPGYTLIDSYWRQTDNDYFYYAEFPSGYDSDNWYYQHWNRSAYSSYENETSRRVVSNSWAGYIYWHWMYSVTYSTSTQRAISHRYGYWNSDGTSGGYLYQYFTAIASSTDCPYLDNYYCCNANLPSYNCASIITNTENVGTPRMFRFNYHKCSYTDYEKVFVYQMVEELESVTEIAPSDTISNVQHWVRYRDR